MTVLLGHAINVLLGECDIEWYIIRLALLNLIVFKNDFIISTKNSENEIRFFIDNLIQIIWNMISNLKKRWKIVVASLI